MALLVKLSSLVLPRDVWVLRMRAQRMTVGMRKTLYIRVYESKLARQGSWIGWHASLADIPTCPHGLQGIFVSNDAVIGRGCVIFHQVTIGSNTLYDATRGGSPTIGDNVYIGAGAKVIGHVRVGNNVRIGANAVVVKDVPDNAVVVAAEPRVFIRENMDNRFYNTDMDGQWGYTENGRRVRVAPPQWAKADSADAGDGDA